jgi:hypothetical protein
MKQVNVLYSNNKTITTYVDKKMPNYQITDYYAKGKMFVINVNDGVYLSTVKHVDILN